MDQKRTVPQLVPSVLRSVMSTPQIPDTKGARAVPSVRLHPLKTSSYSMTYHGAVRIKRATRLLKITDMISTNRLILLLREISRGPESFMMQIQGVNPIYIDGRLVTSKDAYYRARGAHPEFRENGSCGTPHLLRLFFAFLSLPCEGSK